MDIASLVSATTSGNNFQLTVKDSNGQERKLNVSPLAQDQLVEALLVAPPIAAGKTSPRGMFRAQNVRLAEDANRQVMLEVSIGPKATIHFLIPNAVIEGLKKLLNEWVLPKH